MSAARAILHIGCEKTGSTALQETLAAHRAELREQGVVYSTAAGTTNHIRLAAYAANRDDLRRDLGADDTTVFRRDLLEALAAEVRTAPNATYVFSTELCHGRLLAQDEVDRLAALFGSLFAETTIVGYLRRQDAMAVSRRSTLLKAGREHPPFFPDNAFSRLFYDFGALVARWERAFGRDALIVRRFAPGAGPGVPIVADFLAATGLPPLAEPGRRHNPSLRPAWQELIAALNVRIPRRIGGVINPERGDLDALVARLGAGPSARPARRDARAFLRRFADGNEAVRARYFPELDRLFDTDFSTYPPTANADVPSREALLDAVAELWRAANPPA